MKHPHSKGQRQQQRKNARAQKRKATPRPLEGQFELESFEPRLMLAAQPLATLAPDGTLDFNMTDDADAYQVSHLGINADGTDIVLVKNILTSHEEVFGNMAAGAVQGVRNIIANAGGGDDRLVVDRSTLDRLQTTGRTLTYNGGLGSDTIRTETGVTAAENLWNITAD